MGEWFSLRDIDDNRRFLPGVQRHEEFIKIHRTHVPLFPEAMGYLAGARMADPKRLDSHVREVLREYQAVDVGYITSRRGTLLAHQMRVGKTAPALASWQGNAPLVIVAPLPTRPVWLEWIKRLHPTASVEVLSGRSYEKRSSIPDITFLHYDVLPAWHSVSSMGPELVIFDECHVLSNRKSLRSQAASSLASDAKRVVSLTGTPLWNKPEGLYTLLKILHSGAWGSYREFTERYASGQPGQYGWTTGEPSNIEEFKMRQLQFMRRLTWEDVLGHVPKITRSIEVVNVSKKDSRELTLSLEEARATNAVQVGQDARLRRLLGDIKAKEAGTLAARFVSSGQPVVVWTWHKTLAHSIAERVRKLTGTGTFVVTGDESQDEREVAYAAWRQGSGALVVTMAVGQVGIDLSHAHHAIFAELDYTPAMVAQAEMRTFSPDIPMSSTYLVADHDIDRLLVSAIIGKVKMGNDMGMPVGETDLEFLQEAIGREAPDLEAVVRGL